ncbi:MAG: Non-canonical purine NTP pyrophosphatase [Pelotomaculum sp. PtaU1.Bin035]|nr:MAG: Non-canonical purine NTP pyrophosphatase [Pelotomaculum sp. PtaU1.Bin035]
MKLVLATNNKGKVKEMSGLLAAFGIEVLSLNEFPSVGEIEEDGDTFLENAVKKATVTAGLTGLTALADDSGLEVDCLDGAPGVFSARFAGEGKDDRANNEKLLALLAGVTPDKRSARFQCVIAIAVPGGPVYTAQGACEGMVAPEPRGDGGFGYDPLFYLPEYGKTFAEIDLALKNKISHRGKALAGALDILSKLSKEESGGMTTVACRDF